MDWESGSLPAHTDVAPVDVRRLAGVVQGTVVTQRISPLCAGWCRYVGGCAHKRRVSTGPIGVIVIDLPFMPDFRRGNHYT
jgi:hypothetical protein